jgi:hypothetical protein
VAGITQVLYSITVIELAKPGLEATTLELIVTVSNAGLQVAGVVAIQLLTPLKSSGCTSDDEDCSSSQVDINSAEAFRASDGPYRFTLYTICIVCISTVFCVVFAMFLPASKVECRQWKSYVDRKGDRSMGVMSAIISIVTVIVSAFNSSLSLVLTVYCCSMDLVLQHYYCSLRHHVCRWWEGKVAEL